MSYWHSLKLGKDFLVMPVPLYPHREMKRGFNQAAVLANILSRRFYLEISKNNLVRIKNTLAQADQKDFHAREDNVRDAFFVMDPAKLKNKDIILIDDVFTSGATLNEAARMIKLCGAKKIIALVLARAR